MNDHNEAREIGPVLRCFLFCAAADPDLLRDCPKSEHHKYAGVGATVFFTGLLACFSGGYAIFTAFDSFWLSIALGLFWGALVFNLDRFLVSTMKKSRNKTKELIQILPRLILSILLAIVISVPLELKIFEEEINEKMFYSEAQKVDQLDSLYSLRLQSRQSWISEIRARLDIKQENRDQLYKEYICECDGTCGSGAKGRGTECERKEKRYLQIEEEFKQDKLEAESEIGEINKMKAYLASQNTEEREDLRASIADGLLVRIRALDDLPFGPQIAIILLLISIEVAPILVKLLAPYGPYDHLLKTVEYDFEINEITSINMRNQQLNNKLTVMAAIEQSKIEQELINNEGAMNLIGEAHLELVRDQLKIWLDQEKRKLREGSETDDDSIIKV
jgi:hypothetical protein